MTTSTFNHDKAAAFSEKMLETLNAGAVALMLSIGHRTRLFDVLADLPQVRAKRLHKTRV